MSLTEQLPTERELALSAHTRRVEFHQRIEAKAAELKAAKLREATEHFGTPIRRALSVHAIAPEAMPAEPDPPAVCSHGCECPHCGKSLVSDAIFGRGNPTIAEIQIAVARYCNVTRGDILSARRQAHIVRPRQISYYLCKELTPFSLPVIARKHGGRDHTSALSGIRKIRRLLLADSN